MHAIYSHMTPFLAVDDATAMLRIAESLDSFGTYADEASPPVTIAAVLCGWHREIPARPYARQAPGLGLTNLHRQ